MQGKDGAQIRVRTLIGKGIGAIVGVELPVRLGYPEIQFT